MKIGALLARLADVEAAGRRADDRVEVTLHLVSGARVPGVLAGLNGQLVELRERGGAVTFVDLARVEALSLADAEDARDLITAGATERPGDAPAASELQRRASAIGEALGLPIELPRGELAAVERLALGRLLEDLFGALGAVSHEAIDVVAVERGGPELTRDGARLIVRAALDQGPRGRLGRSALEAAVASAD